MVVYLFSSGFLKITNGCWTFYYCCVFQNRVWSPGWPLAPKAGFSCLSLSSMDCYRKLHSTSSSSWLPFFFKMLFKSGGSPQQCLHLVLERWENRKFYTLAWLSTGLKSVCQASWKSSLYVDVYIIVAACQQWPWLCKGFILANTGLWLYQYLHRDWQGVPVLKSCWPLPAPAWTT